ncbi:hypothetical protein JCM10450v2_001589 [Rhodotorula kratochvilovae]
MASKKPEMCLVCATKTTKACGDCGEPFCSPECQKAIWSTHKWLCKKPKYTFSFAPLDEEERAAALEMLKSPDVRQLKSLSEVDIADEDGWREGNFENLIKQLADPDCAIPEPKCSTLLIEIHHMLRFDDHCLPHDIDSSPWKHVAEEWYTGKRGAFMTPGPPMSELRPSHLTILNRFHRFLLVFWTLRLKEREGVDLPAALLKDAGDELGKATAFILNDRAAALSKSYNGRQAQHVTETILRSLAWSTAEDMATGAPEGAQQKRRW